MFNWSLYYLTPHAMNFLEKNFQKTLDVERMYVGSRLYARNKPKRRQGNIAKRK